MKDHAMAIAPLFISHGAPNLALHPSRTREFLKALGGTVGQPRAIVTVSAHFETDVPTVVTDPNPGMIYDFGGFEPELYRQVYAAPGSPSVAQEVTALLADAGLAPQTVARRGYDHGAWVPLQLMWPAADVPVVQLSIQPERDAAHHHALGVALKPLVESDVLILASGSMTHNLRAVFGPRGLTPRDAPPLDWAGAFAEWVAERTLAGDVDALVRFEEAAPHALKNHPTDEHFMPFFVALGAGGGRGVRLHAEIQHGALAMDAYRFEAAA
jgi:4,5-DOPA dioxygenase extradiol